MNVQTQKNQANKVTSEELAMELSEVLKDYFVGKVEQTENGIALSLLGGRKFFISVKESA